jgi:hypothetical protein
MPPGGIRTRNPSKRPAAHLRLRPRGHWGFRVTTVKFESCNCKEQRCGSGGLLLWRCGIRISLRERNFLFSNTSKPTLGAPPAPIHCVPGFLPGVMRPGCDVDTLLHLEPRLRMSGGCPETSAQNYHLTLRNISQKCRSLLHTFCFYTELQPLFGPWPPRSPYSNRLPSLLPHCSSVPGANVLQPSEQHPSIDV